MAQTAAAEGQLTASLGRLFAVVEAYPDLKATGNIAALQEELTSTENKIAFARQLYNDTATSTTPSSSSSRRIRGGNGRREHRAALGDHRRRRARGA